MSMTSMLTKALWTGLAVFACLLCACGEEGGSSCGEGKDRVPDIIEEEDLNTFRVANLGVSEFDIRSGPDAGHRTLVQAHFSDFSLYRVIVADRLPFSEACYIYTSKQVVMGTCELNTTCSLDEQCPEGYSCQEQYCAPSGVACQEDRDCPGILVCDPLQQACISPDCTSAGDCQVGYDCIEGQPIPMDVERVTFSGLAGGDLVMTPDAATGTLAPQILDGRAFQEDSVGFDVASGSRENDFPAFSQTLRVPEAPVVTRVGDVTDPDFASGFPVGINDQRDEPLVVQWEAGQADYIDFKIVPGSGSDTKYIKLRCVTFDDGCLEVPAEALVHLSMDQATNFQMKIERHNFALHSQKDGDVVEAAAMLDVSSVVEGTVTR